MKMGTELCHGYRHIPIFLRATQRYTWETVRGMCKQRVGPFWLRVEGTLIALDTEEALCTGCKVCTAYHDWLAYNAPVDDGFSEEMRAIEDEVSYRMGK